MNDSSVPLALTSWPAKAARCRFPIVCLLVLLFPSYRADGATLKKVFAVGDPVEGLAGITVQQVTQAKLTGDGRVVAVVLLQGPGVVAANRDAIVSAMPGGPVQIWGRAGDPALGEGVPGGSTIANFGSSEPLEASDTGIVARLGAINVPGQAFTSRAVIAGGMGSLRVEVFDEKPWPAFGLGVKLRTGGVPRDPGVSRNGEIAFFTSSSGGGPNAVWRGPPGAVTLVVKEKVKYDGLPGKGIVATLRGAALPNETGELCFSGELEKDFVAPLIVTDANRHRLWKAGPPFVEIAGSGSEIAGGGTLADYQAWAFRGPWALFTANHRQPARTDTVVAIAQAGATPQIILHPQRNAPDAGGNPLGPFASVSPLDTSLLPSGVVITNQRLLIGGSVNSTNAKGIWRWDGAALRLLARQGADVPGLPGRHWSDLRTGTGLPSGKGVFSAFVPEAGSPTNPTKINWTGLWWGDSVASLALLLEDGGPIDLGGSVGTIQSLSFVRSVNDTHLLVDLLYLTAGGSSSVTGLALLDPAAAAPTGTIGGTVRLDYDEDGDLLETGDLPFSGVLCELLARDAAGNPTGPVLKTSISAGNGTYAFADVPRGAYIVRAALDASSQLLGVRWTSPFPFPEGAATVVRSADVTGVPTGKLDFLLTTAIRPDSFADGSDGNVGPGQQSLREALDRAQRKSRLFFRDAVIDLSPGTYLLDAPLVFDYNVIVGGPSRKVTLRAPAARPLKTVLDGQRKTGLMEIKPGGWVKVEGVQFQSGRTDVEGGAVRHAGLDFEAVHCDFVGCRASTKGGAVAILAGRAAFRSCVFSGNSCAHSGGALSCAAATAGSDVTIEDSFISGNSADERGGGIAVEAGSIQMRRTSLIRNTAPLEGAGLMVFSGQGSRFLGSCLLQGGQGNISSLGYNLIEKRAGLTVAAQIGDLFDLDPRLAADGSLLADSPAIDSGDPRFVPATMPEDILGKPRVAGGRIDIGAIEFQGTPNRDKVEILKNSVVPPLSEKMRRDTAYGDFHADVGYQLGSRESANLVLRLFDHKGRVVASSDVVRVTKAEGSVALKRVTFPKFSIRADAEGKYPERLFLRAVFLDPASGAEIKGTPDTDYVFSVLPRAPVLVVPGIAGCYAANLKNDAVWSHNRGRPPWTLAIDPFAHVYDDLVQSLKNAGYVEGENLFIANYDWRMTPGPSDGTNDGVIQMTAAELTDETLSYGVDYFAYWLREAAEAWRRKYPEAGDLQGVDAISHSTGGLVVRAYQQNAARGAIYKTDEKGEHRLPAVERSIMIAVPNSGASKIWNPWNDNWVSDPAYKLVLSKLVARAFKRIQQGNEIPGPLPADAITRASVLDEAGNLSPVRFIRRYVPTIRSLLPTYFFLVNEPGTVESFNGHPEHSNDLLIDLNANMGLMFAGSGAANSVIYSTNQTTATTAERRVGPVGYTDWDPISPMTDYTDRNARADEVWYEDISVENGGDGTVPVISSFGTFAGEPRVKTHLMTEGDTTHTGLCSNRVAQETVFRLLGFDPVPQNLSTDKATTENRLALSAGIDPVECLFTDAAGRRLGYTAETGVLTEIPGSVWLGEADGIALVYGPLDLPLSVRFNGLSEDYRVQLRLSQNGSGMEHEWSGFLEAGNPLAYTVNLPPPGPPRLGDVVRLGNGTIRIGLEGSLAGIRPSLEQSADLNGPWSQATGAILDRIKGQSFIINPPPGATRNYYRVRFGP